MAANYSINVTNLVTNSTIQSDSTIYAHDSYKIKVNIANTNYSTRYKKVVRWDFGDGTVIRDSSATHYYSYPGKYTISCTFYDVDGTPHENSQTFNVYVKEPIATELSFVGIKNGKKDTNFPYKDIAIWKDQYIVSKNNNLGKLFVTLSTNIVTEPQVRLGRVWEDSNREDSYFDIKEDYYYHLKKYYTFLEKRLSCAIDSSFTQTILQPCNELTIKYIPIYGKYTKAGMSAYVICNEFDYNSNCLGGYKTKLTRIKSKSELPSGSSLLGKIGIADIWYKNDNAASNSLVFEFKKDTIKFDNEPISADYYLNIPPLGITFNTIKPTKSEVIKEALTSNGIFNKEYHDNTSNDISIETHLQHNLYLDYTIEAYYSKFIQNDILDGEITYNLLKVEDNSLKNLNYVSSVCKVEEYENKNYYKIYNITPKALSHFKLEYLKDGIPCTYYTADEITDLQTLVLPTEKKTSLNVDELLDVYMQHPMYENAVNLKTLLKDILKNNNMLSYTVAKGSNILNDTVNYKTCHLDKLLSILEMMNEKVKFYDINSFDRINDLKELIRILTMNYSELFGNLLTNEYDIKITHSTKGENVSEQLQPDDAVLVQNKLIVAIKRNGKVLPLLEPTPYLVLKDDFTLQTSLVSFAGIEPTSIEDFLGYSEEWVQNHFGNEPVYAYVLEDYTEDWGWVLNLPDEYVDRTRKTLIIDAYYSFYLFNPKTSAVRKYNFIDESTIPLSKKDKDAKQISVEEWNADYGFTYDCLMKILTNTLIQ